MIIKDIKTNQEYLERRAKELEQIKKISAQVVGITNQMTLTVKEQGEALGGIEENIIVTKDNVIKAEKEISEAEKISRRTNRRIFWLFIILCIIVVSIIVIIVLIFLPNSDNKKTFLI